MKGTACQKYEQPALEKPAEKSLWTRGEDRQISGPKIVMWYLAPQKIRRNNGWWMETPEIGPASGSRFFSVSPLGSHSVLSAFSLIDLFLLLIAGIG